MRGPCSRFGRMLKNAAEALHAVQRVPEHSAVIARTVVLAAPSGIVDVRERSPQLARRVGDNRIRSIIAHCVPRLIPRVYAVKTEIRAVSLYKQCRNLSHIIC